MTSEAREYEALWRKAQDAYWAASPHINSKAHQAAASILRDHVEAKLAEVRANVMIWQSKCQMEADERRREIADRDRTIAEQAAELAKLREALAEISNLPGEINPSDYDHDDACELNRQFCYAITSADAALGGSHE